MLKNILKLDGVQPLNKSEQQSINGGACYSASCSGKPDGAICDDGSPVKRCYHGCCVVA
jgi:hypothetical protein